MMGFPSREEVARLRERYPKGTKVKLVKMNDMYSSLKTGDVGIVQFIDDAGQIHINWECGSTLALIPEVDEFDVYDEITN